MTDLKEAYQKKLLELRPNIIGKDITKAVQKGVAAKPTIYAYLRGDVANIQLAEKIITHFTPVVNQRMERAKKLVA